MNDKETANLKLQTIAVTEHNQLFQPLNSSKCSVIDS